MGGGTIDIPALFIAGRRSHKTPSTAVAGAVVAPS